MKKVLTIAGSDCSGGAGIQADLKTMTALGVYGMSVITSLTAQNTTAVYGIYDASPDFVAAQIDAVFSDIRPDAVKIGMVSNAKLIETIASKLENYKATDIVLDPVMVTTSGSKLLAADAEKKLTECLMPLALLITPNIPEAEILTKSEIITKDDMCIAAEKIAKTCDCNVLLKGGHLADCADDLLYMTDGNSQWCLSEHIDNPNTHGTGCTLSSAIACGLACDMSLPEAVNMAKEYVSGALRSDLNLGKGSGPLNHCWSLRNTER